MNLITWPAFIKRVFHALRTLCRLGLLVLAGGEFVTGGLDAWSARAALLRQLWSSSRLLSLIAVIVLAQLALAIPVIRSLPEAQPPAPKNLPRRRRSLPRLSPAQFEEYVCDDLNAHGYHVWICGGPGDGGADLVGSDPSGRPVIVSCKCYRRPVGTPQVRDLAGALAQRGYSRGVLVTRGRFSRDARELVRDLAVQRRIVITLITGDELGAR